MEAKESTLIMASLDDLKGLISDNAAESKFMAMLARFDNVIVTIKDVAKFHAVNIRTVMNYINDGMITPEDRDAPEGKYLFRLSYVLGLDFKELKKRRRDQKWEEETQWKIKERNGNRRIPSYYRKLPEQE